MTKLFSYLDLGLPPLDYLTQHLKHFYKGKILKKNL